MKGRNINSRHINKVVEMFATTLKGGKTGGQRITYDARRKAKETQNRTLGGVTRWMQSYWH